MTFKQLTVLTGNSVSHLNDVMTLLGGEGINMRAHCLVDNGDSFCKLIANAETRELIGAHLIGPQAATLIQQLIQGMAFGQTVDAHDPTSPSPQIAVHVLVVLPSNCVRHKDRQSLASGLGGGIGGALGGL